MDTDYVIIHEDPLPFDPSSGLGKGRYFLQIPLLFWT